MTIQEANKRLLFELYHIYDNSEAGGIADLVMENITGWRRIDRVMNNTVKLSALQEKLLTTYIEELSAHKPVQYVLREAWFCGLKFYVDENVLIPRPETEELVEWVAEENKVTRCNILDVGTGSGCIAIALKKKIPGAKVYACDVSEPALEIARKNAAANETTVEFLHIDILDREARKRLPEIDIIVSNPPYIPVSEKSSMKENVTSYEPHLALFVDEKDPLTFYKAIAEIPVKIIYAEVHEDLAGQTAALFRTSEVRTDMQGKQRMIRFLGRRH
jgi:release factor glutamine methyltransferase